MLPSSAIFMILNSMASHYTQQSATFGHIQGIIALYIWFIPALNAPLVFIVAWLIQRKRNKGTQPAGGAYVSPAAGDPSAHP
jgi:hypothetical protein